MPMLSYVVSVVILVGIDLALALASIGRHVCCRPYGRRHDGQMISDAPAPPGSLFGWSPEIIFSFTIHIGSLYEGI
jgi:hypothetical protein